MVPFNILSINAQSYDAIEIEKYIILKTLQDIHFQYFIFVNPVGLKHFGKYMSNIILITKYLNLEWNLVKSFFYQIKD